MTNQSKQLAIKTSRPKFLMDKPGNNDSETSEVTGKRGFNATYKPRFFPVTSPGENGTTRLDWSSADTTVPDRKDKIISGDLPTRTFPLIGNKLPKDYEINKTFSGTDYGSFNDITNPQNKKFPGGKPIDYYNEEVKPIEVSPEDRKTIDNYLKGKGQVGPLKRISHYNKDKPTIDDVYYGDQYARDEIVPKPGKEQIIAGYKQMAKELPNTIKNKAGELVYNGVQAVKSIPSKYRMLKFNIQDQMNKNSSPIKSALNNVKYKDF